MPRHTRPQSRAKHSRGHLRHHRDRVIERRWAEVKNQSPYRREEQSRTWQTKTPPVFIHPDERRQVRWWEHVPPTSRVSCVPDYIGQLADHHSLTRYWPAYWDWDDFEGPYRASRGRRERQWRRDWEDDMP